MRQLNLKCSLNASFNIAENSDKFVMFQAIVYAVIIYIASDIFGYFLAQLLTVAHGDAVPGSLQHVYVIHPVAKGISIF